MGQLDKNIFGGKKFSDILEEIYNNQKKKEEQISTLISELKPLIQDIGDATLVSQSRSRHLYLHFVPHVG